MIPPIRMIIPMTSQRDLVAIYPDLPVVPHKAVAEVSKIGNL